MQNILAITGISKELYYNYINNNCEYNYIQTLKQSVQLHMQRLQH